MPWYAPSTAPAIPNTLIDGDAPPPPDQIGPGPALPPTQPVPDDT